MTGLLLLAAGMVLITGVCLWFDDEHHFGTFLVCAGYVVFALAAKPSGYSTLAGLLSGGTLAYLYLRSGGPLP